MAKKEYPSISWKLRFRKAIILIYEAGAEIEHAHHEGNRNSNYTFEKMRIKMKRDIDAVAKQLILNYKRGKKEGWLK